MEFNLRLGGTTGATDKNARSRSGGLGSGELLEGFLSWHDRVGLVILRKSPLARGWRWSLGSQSGGLSAPAF